MSAIVVRDLTRRFGKFVAVDHVSFDVREGEIFGFLGSNGAGKSTTIRMLCGLLRPTSGTATVGGADVGTDPERVKTRIGYMSQRFSLYEKLTVDQNIRFYAGLYGISGERFDQRRAFVLEMAGLRGREDMFARDLPGGWRQRLALGCAILHEPPIIFLDEPTSGVDPISRRLFWDLIYELAGKGVTVFVTTHYMDEAEYCDRIGLIYRGELIAVGTPGQLKTELMQEDVLEVAGERPQDAMGEIEKLAGIREVALFGKGLHVVAEDGQAAAGSVRELLAQRGFAIARVEKIVPSLEDVFVSLIEARDRAEQPQQEVRR